MTREMLRWCGFHHVSWAIDPLSMTHYRGIFSHQMRNGKPWSVASIIGLLLPANDRRMRLIHAIYGLSIAILAGGFMYYQQRISRIEDVERAAERLIENRNYQFTDAGFIQATLTFFEVNKDLYPDTYARAQEFCQINDCLDEYNNSSMAYTMEGLLQGIAYLSASE